MPELDIHAILATLPPDFRQPLTHDAVVGGQSLVRLYRLTYAWGTAILKGPLQAREEAFYREVAPSFAARAIVTPEVLAWGSGDGSQWLLREDLPTLLPPLRWIADPGVLAYLRHLHALPLAFSIPQPFVPGWHDIAPDYQALLPAPTRAIISQLKSEHIDLFTPQCVISGDDNIENWGVRADNSVVLFDWDRVGYGVPARDLAVYVPGLGWPTLFRQVAAAYLAQGGEQNEAAVARLAHDMAIAKLQTIVEYVNTPEITEERRAFNCTLLPSWVEMIAQMDVAFHAQHFGEWSNVSR